VPNRACAEAMLRASGFTVETRAEDEVYICRRAALPYADYGETGAVYPATGRI
jgi:tRNA (mo5U34)-methyltransferase